jgi:choline monooxygenase
LPCYEKVFYTMRVNPVSPVKTELIYTIFAVDEFSEEQAVQFYDFMTKITDEDFAICELVQKNLQAAGSSLYPHGYLNTTRENGVHYFHELIRKAVSTEVKLGNEQVVVSA